MNRRWLLTLGFTSTLAIIVGGAVAFSRDPQLPIMVATPVATYPHDPGAFSQGLVVDQGQLYEGTGQYGSSSLRRVDLETGRVLQSIPLTKDYFGEGVTVLNGRVYQLTWKERLGIVYELPELRPVGSFRYSGEGWGLTTDGQELILSDGSAILRFIDPKTFEVTRRIEVRAGRNRVDKLNELEFVEGEIFANIWYSDRIARIHPKTGEVTGWIDASQLYPANRRPSREHVLNGIAYDAATRKLYLTGKNWPKLYEVELQPPR